MTDEVYEFIQDCKDKKITARSARNKRTHTGKGGRVRFPSDNLTKKEREAMNGEVKSYRMNDPVSWKEFKSWPEEHQITYIKLLRQKYNAPDKAIAIMMGVSRPHLCRYIGELGLSLGRGANKKSDSWDEDGFYAWCGMVKVNSVRAIRSVFSSAVFVNNIPGNTNIHLSIAQKSSDGIQSIICVIVVESHVAACGNNSGGISGTGIGAVGKIITLSSIFNALFVENINFRCRLFALGAPSMGHLAAISRSRLKRLIDTSKHQ